MSPAGSSSGRTSSACPAAPSAPILCLPGSAFGPDQESYLRFALANIDADAMETLGERLEASQA